MPIVDLEMNPITWKLDLITSKLESEDIVVEFDWEYSEPSWTVSWTSIQDWIDLHFQSIDPNVSVSLNPSNFLREYWNDVVNPHINPNITLWSNPTWTITNIEYFRWTTAWTLIHSWTETTFQDTFTVSSYQRYTVRITDSEWRIDSWSSSYSFVYPIFYWVVNSWDIYDWITETEIDNLLTKNISTKRTKSFTSSPIAKRYCFAYPQSYWNLSSIIDKNWFETIWDYDIYNYTINNMLDNSNQNYYIYILKNDTTQTDFLNTYYF